MGTADERAGWRDRGRRTWVVAGGVVALGLAAASAPAALAPASADAERVERAASTEPLRSGDEDHFDGEEPPPVSPAVDLPAGRNDIDEASAWSGLWGPEIEPLATYEPQRLCLPGPRPAVAAFADLLERAHPVGTSLGITRPCTIGARSEHKEGRAYDWGVDVTVPAERSAAEELIAWLLATDEHGNDFAMARRLGVMYLIWDGHIWSSASAHDGWRVYRGPSPHTDHVHLSFSWAGATGSTSFWDVARVGPWLLEDVVLERLPPRLDLGTDRYRSELGPLPGRLVDWGVPSGDDGEAPGQRSDDGTGPAPDDEPAPTTTTTAPAAVPGADPVPVAPEATTPDRIEVPIVDDVVGSLDAPTPTVTVPPPVDEVVDDVGGVVDGTADDVGGVVDGAVGGVVGDVGDAVDGVVGGVDEGAEQLDDVTGGLLGG